MFFGSRDVLISGAQLSLRLIPMSIPMTSLSLLEDSFDQPAGV